MEGRAERRSEWRNRASNRIRFALEQLILRGIGYRLLLAAAIIAAVALFAGILVAVLDPGLSEPGEAVWWAFLRLTERTGRIEHLRFLELLKTVRCCGHRSRC
jgi:hypothetical protein